MLFLAKIMQVYEENIVVLLHYKEYSRQLAAGKAKTQKARRFLKKGAAGRREGYGKMA